MSGDSSAGKAVGGQAGGDAVGHAVADLYALDPGEFVAARDKAAATLRADGDKAGAAAVKKLGRPTVAAWALNQLVRANPDLVDRVAELGERLRDAQATLDAAALKALRPRRDALLDEAGHAAATVAAARGQSLGSAADEVRSTLVAALAEEAATEALRSGRLVRALSYAGFGEVELDDAVATLPVPAPRRQGRGGTATPAAKTAPTTTEARPTPERPTTPTGPTTPTAPETTGTSAATKGSDADDGPRRAEALDRARRAAQAAEHVLHAAQEEATAAGLAEAGAQEQLAAAQRRTTEFRRLLEKAEKAEAAAEQEREEAAADRAQADRRVADAAAAWSRAKLAVADLAD